MILPFFGMILALLLLFAGGPIKASTLAGWTQYAADGKVEARIVTDEGQCPSLLVDGAAQTMTERSAPSSAFPNRLCAAILPPLTRTLSAGGRTLPVPAAHPHHLVLLGDTGCRLKGEIVQACNSESAWPFHQVALHAAAEHPDLVIHVGDYLYRETPCKDDDARCKGTPTGDNWPTWNADFFAPGEKLLGAATWVLERGNHEDCKRAGTGWTTLLGRDPVTSACNPHDKPLLVDFGDFRIGVLDENDADDKGEPIPALVELLRHDLATLMTDRPNWIVTHHPFRGVVKIEKDDSGNKILRGTNPNLQAAVSAIEEQPLTLMLAGHIHNFQIENYRAPKAPQLVVGEGGDKLDTDVPLKLTGLVTGGNKILSGLSVPGFGYVVADRVGASQDWRLTVHAANGKVMRHCALQARKLSCRKS